MKHLKTLDVWIGNTRELIRLRDSGMKIRYSVSGVRWDVVYMPRSLHDPQPWFQVGGYGFRFRSTEIHAERKL